MINRIRTKEFHFVLSGVLKAKLMLLSRLLNLNMSKTVIFIAENASVLLGKCHFLYKEENEKVERVNWDCNIHLYLPKDKRKIYNKLKSIHKDNSTYSMAKSLRYAIRVFIRGVENRPLEKSIFHVQLLSNWG